MLKPLCKQCGINLASSKGKGFYKRTCTPCRRNPWKKYKKDKCEFCGFIPVHQCQLDVDHIDGNKQNNDPINLQTLCANCHRLKTHLNKEYVNK